MPAKQICLRCNAPATLVCFEKMYPSGIERFTYRCGQHTTGRVTRIPKSKRKA